MNYQSILKRQTSIILISVIVMVLIIIGVSYSLFMQVDESNDVQVVESGTLVLSSNKGNTITTNNVPLSDIEGLGSEGYTFSVKNNGTLGYLYNLYINNKASSNPLEYEYIKISFDDGPVTKLSDLEVDSEKGLILLANNYIAPANEEGDVVTHNIKVWIEETAPTSIIGKNILLQIDMYGEAGETFYKDSSGASEPELYSGLIPVTYNDTNEIVIADLYSNWYDYDAHEWANAILIDQNNTTTKNKYLNTDGTYKSGTVVEETDILQMYVWVPRYKYQLFNVEGADTEAQMINIQFESNTTSKSNGTQNGEWLTHPAFTFGTTELNGIWVGKFESSGTSVDNQSISDITIIPNAVSIRNQTLSNMFNATRAIETTAKYGLDTSTVDTHMMKNMEWGAVAYLTSSKYGIYIDASSCINSECEVWTNNNSSYTTGCAGDSVSASRSSSCNQWNTTTGVNASTTGNIYGIYDMSGGAWEYVMGNYNKTASESYSGIDFNSIDSKYYDVYTGEDVSYGMLGDATKETQGWNSDYASFVDLFSPWFMRGGLYSDAGVFHFTCYDGRTYFGGSFRVVLSSE